MKIMYVIHSLIIGGAETIVANYLIQLKKMGQDVVLLQVFDRHTFLNQRLVAAGVRVVTACRSSEQGFFSKIDTVRNFRRIIKKEQPDVLHVHTGLEKFRYIRYPAEKMVFTLHSAWERSLNQGKNHRKMLFRLIQEGMSMIVLSEKAKEDVLKQFPEARVYKIPNGFDLEAIREKRYDRKEFLETLKIPDTAFVLGHVGRFHRVKNHEMILSVFEKVLEKRKDAHLLLVGGGREEEMQPIAERARACGIIENVHFLGERQDATAVMSIFDCLILPSHSEAFPLVLIEAQALGLRAVSSTGVPEDVCVSRGCFRLSLDEPLEKWAEYILGDFLRETENSVDQFEIYNIMERHLELYDAIQ